MSIKAKLTEIASRFERLPEESKSAAPRSSKPLASETAELLRLIASAHGSMLEADDSPETERQLAWLDETALATCGLSASALGRLDFWGRSHAAWNAATFQDLAYEVGRCAWADRAMEKGGQKRTRKR